MERPPNERDKIETPISHPETQEYFFEKRDLDGYSHDEAISRLRNDNLANRRNEGSVSKLGRSQFSINLGRPEHLEKERLISDNNSRLANRDRNYSNHNTSLRINDISVIGDREPDFKDKKVEAWSDNEEDGTPESKILDSLSLDNSKLSADSKYNEYLAECMSETTSNQSSMLNISSQFNFSMNLGTSQIEELNASKLNVSRHLSGILAPQMTNSKLEEAGEVSDVGRSFLKPILENDKDQDLRIYNRNKRVKPNEDAYRGMILPMLGDRLSFDYRQTEEREMRRNSRILDRLNCEDKRANESILGKHPRSFFLDDTQQSIFSLSASLEDFRDTFIQEFKKTDLHEKFFRTRPENDDSNEKSEENDFVFQESLKKRRIRASKFRMANKEKDVNKISLELFSSLKTPDPEKIYEISKLGLENSKKNTFAREIVFGRRAPKLEAKNLIMQDLAFSANQDKSISRLHCLVDSRFFFPGSFKITSKIKNFLLCLHRKRNSKSLIHNRPFLLKIFQFFQRPKEIVLYDLGSKTGTFIRVSNPHKLSLQRGVSFLLGEDAIFKVHTMGNFEPKKLHAKFPKSIWCGFDDSFLSETSNSPQRSELRVLILQNSNASSNLRDFVILKYIEGREYLVGRSPHNDINLNLSNVSRMHAA